MAMLIPGIIPADNWYFGFNYNPTKQGPGCCSDNSVSFHYVDPNWMYMLEFFVYHLNPYGVAREGRPHSARSHSNTTNIPRGGHG